MHLTVKLDKDSKLITAFSNLQVIDDLDKSSFPRVAGEREKNQKSRDSRVDGRNGKQQIGQGFQGLML